MTKALISQCELFCSDFALITKKPIRKRCWRFRRCERWLHCTSSEEAERTGCFPMRKGVTRPLMQWKLLFGTFAAYEVSLIFGTINEGGAPSLDLW
jgi:hypothetical protein